MPARITFERRTLSGALNRLGLAKTNPPDFRAIAPAVFDLHPLRNTKRKVPFVLGVELRKPRTFAKEVVKRGFHILDRLLQHLRIGVLTQRRSLSPFELRQFQRQMRAGNRHAVGPFAVGKIELLRRASAQL